MSAVSDSAASSKPARSGSGEPVASARSSAWSSSACHSNHAGPTSSGGAAPASTAHACTRSGSSAAHASAADPPPDQPATRNVEAPRWSASAAVFAASCTTARPGLRVEPS